MEEKAMKLLGLVWAKAYPEDIKAAAQAVMSEQRPDGGWAQLPYVESDAYATGQALTALHAGRSSYSVHDRIYNCGAAFLLRTQRPDGSWLVRSRSFPFQPYKESGFPHGKDQWISAAGTKFGHDGVATLRSLPLILKSRSLTDFVGDITPEAVDMITPPPFRFEFYWLVSTSLARSSSGLARLMISAAVSSSISTRPHLDLWPTDELTQDVAW